MGKSVKGTWQIESYLEGDVKRGGRYAFEHEIDYSKFHTILYCCEDNFLGWRQSTPLAFSWRSLALGSDFVSRQSPGEN